MIRIILLTTMFFALSVHGNLSIFKNENKEVDKVVTMEENTALANIGGSDLSNEGQSSSDVIIRAKRYYGCGCCGCGTPSSVTYSPCGCGCCG